MNMSNNEERILNYLGDKILSNRWKEYEKIHLLIMRSELNKDEYLDMCDKLRELEKEIESTLSGRAMAIKRKEMYRDIIDRDRKTLERTQ
jgi:hypothetical protein